MLVLNHNPFPDEGISATDITQSLSGVLGAVREMPSPFLSLRSPVFITPEDSVDFSSTMYVFGYGRELMSL